jgi:hypothetical protein
VVGKEVYVSNPLDDFYSEFGEPEQEKQAGSIGSNFGSAMAQGLGVAAAGTVMGLGGMAVNKLMDAATKGRDFRNMLANNPDLEEHRQRDPKMFNQMYSSLRHMNQHFASDPVVAGTYMRRMVENPMTAGGILSESVSASDKFKNPHNDTWRRATERAESSFGDSLKGG